MKFEEKWLDVEIINIEFLSFEKKRYNRVFIIPVGLTKKEIVTFLQKEFYHSICKINSSLEINKDGSKHFFLL